MARSKAQAIRSAARLSAAVQPPKLAHPVVSAVLFSDSISKNGGASMDVNTNKVYEYGQGHGIAIGGEPDSSGKPIETKYHGANLADPTRAVGLPEIIRHRDEIRDAIAGRPESERSNVLLGAWNPTKKDIKDAAKEGKDIRGVNIDASRIYPKSEANKVFKARPEEKAGTDMSNFETVSNPYFKKK
jgi:hypothetical protein